MFTRSEVALFRSAAGEVLLAREGRDEIDILIGSASVIWGLLDRPRTTSGLGEILEDLYRVPVRMIRDDIDGLLEDLEARGWVREVRADV